ncbi:uncharacterized protein LOC113770732 [Coffea eugenioides]|uniref:uncharacterized protein LOC113770732 n=1 Tax=Coffea eugenioides TaxID=49369 RepID=UPI000F615574|nr:uncharacterized protein LOC113770732 [Coffea eugenioides]
MALNPRILKAGLGLLAVCLAAYILGPPLYWQFKEGLASVKRSSSSSSASPYTTSSAISCPPCHCDCSAQSLPSIPQGLSNNSFAGQCSDALSLLSVWLLCICASLYGSRKCLSYEYVYPLLFFLSFVGGMFNFNADSECLVYFHFEMRHGFGIVILVVMSFYKN